MIFVSTTSVKDHSDAALTVQRLAREGIRNIELGADHEYSEDINKIIEFKRGFGLDYTVHSFFPPEKKKFMLNIGSGNEQILKDSLRVIKNSIDFCRKADAKLYSMHCGHPIEIDGSGKKLSEPIDTEKFIRLVKQNIADISDHAKEYGMKVALENQPAENKESQFTRPSQLLAMIKELNLKNLGLLIDVGHLKVSSTKTGFDRKEEIEKVRDNIMELHVHSNDGTYDSHKPPVNSEVLDCIPGDVIKNSIVTLEGLSNWSMDDIKKSFSFVKNLEDS